jgi:hypothetical protein
MLQQEDVCNSVQRTPGEHGYGDGMSNTDRTVFKRLILQIERDLLAQSQLKILLAAADTTIAGDREELRSVKARIGRAQRARRVNGGRALH